MGTAPNKMQKLTAMILAAGKGVRLKPITNTLPKPLIKIGELTLIERNLIKLQGAGFTKVIINLHHLGEQISSYLGDGSRYKLEIKYLYEKTLLDTAGGIANALYNFDKFNNQPFALVSADALSDFNFHILAKIICEEKIKVNYLILIDNPDYHPDGDFCFDSQSKQLSIIDTSSCDISNNINLSKKTFAGFAVFHPQVFANINVGEVVPLKPILNQLIKNDNLWGEVHKGAFFDCGTIERLELAQKWLTSSNKI